MLFENTKSLTGVMIMRMFCT